MKKNKEIKKVHVIYKSHLDVGFTDLAKNVIDKYIKYFIPKAIKLANKVNKDESNKKFVWTVGSWLIDEYLRRINGKAGQEFIDAINKGYIVWHGLPFTTHSELMDEELFDYGISISKNLDRAFSRSTIAAKMTDVPGHTKGIIGLLHKNGIKYLHIGVNAVSHKPYVPDTFIWRDSKGNDLIVNYCQSYGETTIVPGFDEVLVFAHSGDNSEPPDEEDIYKQIENIQEQFPGAEVKASTLDHYARALMEFRGQLPVVTDEIGDTWIHGIATDPYKVSVFLELLRLKNRWIKEGRLEKDSNIYREFMRNLLMIPEHTWGLDFKKYLADYKNWRKQDFIKARNIDILSDEYIPEKYMEYGEFAKHEFKAQIKHLDWKDRSYSLFEASHKKQRDYLDNAVESLPLILKEDAQNAQGQIFEHPQINHQYKKINLYEEFEIGDFKISVLKNGSVKVQGQGLHKPAILGKAMYQLFGLSTFDKWKKEYMINLDTNKLWAIPDFFKPGIEDAGVQQDDTFYYFTAENCAVKENELIIELKFNGSECEEYGCPRKAVMKYIFNHKQIYISSYFLNKDASRLPEALWVSHFVDNDSIREIKFNKLGEIIDPFKVVKYGNRNYHSIREVGFKLNNTICRIVPLDSTLVSLGEMRLYNFNQEYAEPRGGIHFNLYNNLWGTNFKMWYEEDIISRFLIETDFQP
ncbi:DUF5054 domain-containing protein [Clostridium sp. DJ247]|uniref:DUF5054 domain-containing protein n=1 Tax=Clostridium sp. DJ247 TaxID=2726188 RepID=UPI001628CDCF|nr:DUF5054 domain-containing protein [Clostridium sp. DJ247]MBC2582305.1 DUF5054 domain-containing protein [Clostridium sp. DJ247]